MANRFRESGLRRREFCDLEGIPLSTLDWWLYQSREKGNKPVDVKFREVRIEPAGVPPTSWGMEVLSPRGWTLRCREILNAADMARLLKSLKC